MIYPLPPLFHRSHTCPHASAAATTTAATAQVCHALTGNARLDEWWGEILGPGQAFDTDKYLVVCANVLGSCYGSTGPQSDDPATGRPYGMDFPAVTIRDSVSVHAYALLTPSNTLSNTYQYSPSSTNTRPTA